LERVNPDFVLLAKTAQKAGMKQAITTYNSPGMVYIDGELAGGQPLMTAVLNAIMGNNSGFAVAAFNSYEPEVEGKLVHLEGVMQYFGVTSKASVLLIDDSRTNIELAKQAGFSTARATSGRGFDLRLVSN
jgi:hypothetical protein